MAKQRQSSPSLSEAAPKPDERPDRKVAPELAELRAAIDAVDRELLERLNERARLVQRVGEFKRESGAAPVYVASRERDLIGDLVSLNSGPFPDAGIRSVFREIISATRSLEETVRVAFLGPTGTFSHEATRLQFGAQVELVPVSSMAEVFELTERGRVHHGVVPIENTTQGIVTASLDLLVDSEVTICGELMLEVPQHLMSQSGQLTDVEQVVSHLNPLGQCARWLETNLPGIPTLETSSTAKAAELAAGDPRLAAIASAIAAESYGLRLIESGIEDSRRNTTRFLVIGNEAPAPSGDDLTAAVFTVRKDQSGALFHLLEPFARFGVNLSSIQSRPMKGKPWEYLFFVDMEGHVEEENVAQALAVAAEVAYSSKILGSFPRAPKNRRAVEGL